MKLSPALLASQARKTGRPVAGAGRAAVARDERHRPPIVLRLPPPVALNRLYKRTRRGVCLCKAAVAWKELVAKECAARRLVPFAGPVWLKMQVCGCKADADAYLKLCLDSLQGYAYINDRQVQAVSCEKVDGEGRYVVVTVGAEQENDERKTGNL